MREIHDSEAKACLATSQEEIESAIEGIMAHRKRNGKITFEELRSARDEGREVATTCSATPE
jgi:hypothetical protein